MVEQELPTLPEHPSSPPVFSAVRVTRSLVLCVCFVDYPFVLFLLVLVSVLSLVYGFCLPLWYLQTLHKEHES
jgi:Flp pilus assembly protein TadB